MSFSRSLIAPVVALSMVLFAFPVFAGRTLTEPKTISAMAKEPASPARESAWKARGLEDRCTPETFRSKEISGVLCRLAYFAEQSAAGAIATPADIDKRIAAAMAALDTADALATYKPLNQPPGLAEQVFTGHSLACDVLLESFDALNGVPKAAQSGLHDYASKAMSDFSHKENKGLQDAACRCTQRSLNLGSAAGASLEKLGGLQQAMTGRSCFLDQSKIKSERGGPNTEFVGKAKEVAEDSSTEGKFLTYAKSRDLGLERCRSKNISSGIVKDKARLKQCVCGDIRRWSFPKERGRPETSVAIPIVENLVQVQVKVKANGQVADCGPLEGNGVR